MPDKKLTDKEIIKEATEAYNQNLGAGCYVGDLLRIINCLEARIGVYETCNARKDEAINRLEAENKKFKERQKPTGASGYIIENGKVVFFTKMLGGCKIVKENLEEVVKTLNELLQEAYAKDEIAFALKCKTEELKTAKADIKKLTSGKCVYLSDDETTEYCVEGPCPVYKTEAKIKAEAYKEFAERLKTEYAKGMSWFKKKESYYVDVSDIDNLVKEMVGENND